MLAVLERGCENTITPNLRSSIAPRLISMAVANRNEFIACISKSKAIAADKFKEWLDSVDDEDPKKIASKLIQDELLTPWQAKFLLSGRSRISVGNYFLQTRISRDELGDKFEALHSQLNRKVVIQVFPSSVSKNESLLNKLLEKLRAITELDHPNLVHVYDIDQEGERYFLVTEFVEGELLNSISPKKLTDSEVAVIINGIGSGLAYSHENEIIHGNVSPDNIIVTPKGKAELEGFPSATLYREGKSDTKPASAESDFRRLSKIGLALLKKLPESSRSEHYDDLNEMIKGLKKSEDRDASLASLGEWVATHVPATDGSSIVEVPPEDDSFLSTDVPNGAGDFDSPMSTVAPTTLKKKKPEPETPEPKARGFLVRMWEEKRAAFITAVAALSLFLAGGLVTLGIAIGGGSGPQSPEQLVASNDVKAAKASPLSKPSGGGKTNEVLDPEANRKKLEQFFKERDGKKKTPKEKKQKQQPTANTVKAAEPDATELDADEPDAAELDAAEPDADAEAKKNPRAAARAKRRADAAAKADAKKKDDAKEKDDAKAKAKEAAGKPTPPGKAPVAKATAKIGNPFEKFVESIDLPVETDTKDLKIADLVIEKNHLLGLKLLSQPSISRAKITFALNRSEDDKQLWNVELTPKRSTPVAVAQFQKTPTEMKFRWLPAAAQEKDAGYLRNCLLELATPKDSTWLRLRSPVDLNEFAFAEDLASTEYDFELPWLPNPKNVKIELQPFNIGTRNDEVGFEPREFTPQESGRIFFRDKLPERFFYIGVSADLRKKSKLKAQAEVILPNGKTQQLRSMEDLVKFATALGNEAKATQYQSDQLAKLRANTRPPNMSNEELVALRKETKANATKLTKSFGLSQQYVELSKEFSGRVIPLQIYFEMENHRIIIAESKASKK